jgi:hypothetical protein
MNWSVRRRRRRSIKRTGGRDENDTRKTGWEEKKTEGKVQKNNRKYMKKGVRRRKRRIIRKAGWEKN